MANIRFLSHSEGFTKIDYRLECGFPPLSSRCYQTTKSSRKKETNIYKENKFFFFKFSEYLPTCVDDFKI